MHFFVVLVYHAIYIMVKKGEKKEKKNAKDLSTKFSGFYLGDSKKKGQHSLGSVSSRPLNQLGAFGVKFC